MSAKNLSEFQVIRALGDDECIYDNEVLQGNFMLTIGSTAEIPKEFANKFNFEILKRAVEIWKSQYTILQASIFRPFDEKNLAEMKIGPTRYFVYDSNKNFNNVELKDCKKIDVKKELESEVNIPFDCINGPYWRIKVIRQVNEKENQDSHQEFLFLYTSNHALNDGKNTFHTYPHFIDILASLLDGSQIEMKFHESKICMEDMARDYRSRPDYKSFTAPNPYDTSFNKVSMKIGNKESKNVLRMEYLKLEKEKLSKLMAKMKKNTNGAKLNSVLDAVACICLRKLYDKYQVDDIDKMDLIQIKVLANIRDKLGVPASQMGVYSVMLDVQENMKELNEETFWKYCEKSSIELHNRIKNNEDMEQPGSEPAQVLNDMLNNSFDFSKSINIDFLSSNIGVMPGNKKRDVIKCEDFFCVCQHSRPSFISSSSSSSNNLLKRKNTQSTFVLYQP